MALVSASTLGADKPKFYDQVLAIDGKSITLHRPPAKEVKYTLTPATKVIVDYRQARIEDIKVGMKATVDHKTGSDEASSISARTMK